jgi:hypothetical protein
MAFSAALALTDVSASRARYHDHRVLITLDLQLNDFLGPSQECIKPVEYIEEPESTEKEAGSAAVGARTGISHAI